MITTVKPVLDEVSDLLNEVSVTDAEKYSSKRITYSIRALRHIIKQKKWTWNKVEGALTISSTISEYNLVTAFPHYNPSWGLHEVYVDGKKLSPINYNRKDDVSDLHFYLAPDMKTIGFTKSFSGTEVVKVWYAASVAAGVIDDETETLPVQVPEDILGVWALYTKALVHGGKRQRFDERNALLDFKQELSESKSQDGSNKVKDLPRTVPSPFAYRRFRRSYDY